ncbi:hypothetical protein [Neoactinobaculum massilliense]|uniref:hypothetical protein n=1 Tax=Neoactinobaculum massilliense TaxID=2364794 RepID=UPI000F5413C5|nr:hypothetical protein [Neoactinobaculum massilliense]
MSNGIATIIIVALSIVYAAVLVEVLMRRGGPTARTARAKRTDPAPTPYWQQSLFSVGSLVYFLVLLVLGMQVGWAIGLMLGVLAAAWIIAYMLGYRK